jgi:hypothetical protein
MRTTGTNTAKKEPAGSFYEEVWLLGQPPLVKYLDFVKDMVIGGDALDPKALTDEWRAANDYYHELEERESGIADEAECLELDPELEPLAAETAASPYYRHTFDSLPTSFALVELDRLIVYQTSVTRDFVEALKVKIGPAPDSATLFHLCLPREHPSAPVVSQKVGSRRYVLRSDSADFRFHRVALLKPEQLQNYSSFGPIASVVGAIVGFGSNFLNVIRVDNRLVLHNGYHRACALRALGVTHVPCIVQTVTRFDELELTAKTVVVEHPDFYFKTARPPLLKDFFDPRIRKILPTRKLIRMIEVNFEIKDYIVPE